jgi:hypothetical protein
MSTKKKLFLAAAGAGGVGGKTVAFVADGYGDKVVSVDISGSTLSVLDTIATSDNGPAFSCAVDADNDILFVGGYRKVYSYDISDPSNMTALNTFSTQDPADTTGLAFDSTTSILYATSGRYVHSLNTSLVQQDLHSTGVSVYSGVRGIALDTENEEMYITGGNDNFLGRYNISNPSNISTIQTRTSSSTLDQATRVAVDPYNTFASGKYYVYTTEFDDDRLQAREIVNNSDPDANPNNEVGGSTTNGIYDVKLDTDNQVAFVSTHFYNGIAAIDISDPTNMSLTSVARDEPRSERIRDIDLDLENSYLYSISDTGQTLHRWDISNTSSMTVDTYLNDSTNFSDPQGLALK